MKQLHKFWFVEAPIDLEFKQYVLLDFLQGVKSEFSEEKLYPALSSLVEQVKTMGNFIENRNSLMNRMKTVKGVKDMQIEYEMPDPGMRDVTDIVEYSLPRVQKWTKKGAMLYESVERSLEWHIVGLVPKYVDEGYFILHVGVQNIFCYRYKVEHIILNEEGYFGITCELVNQIKSRLKCYENIKNELIKNSPELPVPMTFSIETPELPVEETIMPIVKRNGMKRIKNGLQ